MNPTHVDSAAPAARPALPAALTHWFGRVRIIAAAAIIWTALYLALDLGVLPVGFRRPATVLVGYGGAVAAVVTAVVVIAGAAVATLLVPRRSAISAAGVVGFGLAAWAAGRGNINDWLISRNPTTGPANASAYWPLFAECLWAAVLVVGVVITIQLLQRPSPGAPALLHRTLGPTPAARREGPLALLITAAVGALGLLLLTGSIVGQTRRGQIYFAVIVGFVFGVIAARRICRHAAPFWFWVAPIVVGIVGVLFASLQPGRLLGADYAQLNLFPAIGLVRALPIELLGVGLVSVCWGLHISHAGAEAEPRET